jgi:LemA protein
MTVVWIVLFIASAWAIITYNRLVRDRIRVETAWSDIDVQLKRRHDLIPKLVEAVRQYAAYESATLSAVTALRGDAHREANAVPANVSATEQRVSQELQRLVAVAEAYPELQANASFLDLQASLTDVEEHIQFARRYYNGAVRNLNIRIDSFPDSLIAHAFRFEQAEFFDYEENNG